MKKIFVLLFLLLVVFVSGCTKSYKVEFIVDGKVIDTQTVAEGKNAIAPENPVKVGYEFMGWEGSYEKVTGDIQIIAKFEQRSYTVNFYDYDGSLIKTEQVEANASATAPELVNGEFNTYTGWDKEFDKVTSDLEITALIEEEILVVSFYDNDGKLLGKINAAYGSDISSKANFTVQEKEGHHFSGWDEDLTEVTDYMNVYPVYEKNKYTVRFYNADGSILRESKVVHGKDAVIPGNPIKKGYKFVKWDKEADDVTCDLDIYPEFELATYTIKYIDGNKELTGLTPTEYTINSDASITLPDVPEKEGYKVIGWYEENTRVVTFFSADAEDKVFVATYEELPKPLEMPKDMTFVFKALKKVATANGTTVYQPDWVGVSVPSTSASSWNWSSLNTKIANVSIFSSISAAGAGYTLIRAENIKDPKIVGYAVIKVNADGIYISSIEEANNIPEYTVTFTDENGKAINTQTVKEGEAALLPAPPKKEGYTFVGWSGLHYNIQGNTTLEPTYVQGTSDFVGKTVSILGDSISTYKNYVPSGYSCFYPYPTADFGDVNQTWWMQVTNNLGMTLLMNNSYSGSCVSTGTGSSAATNDARLQNLLFGTQKPDVIIINMGANDCASANVSLDTFTSSYKLMLDKIQKLCPDSEIYLLTLPSCGLYTDNNKVLYNEVIRNCAKTYEVGLVELADTYSKETYVNYVVDSVHPNKAGMAKIAEDVIKGMLKLKGVTK